MNQSIVYFENAGKINTEATLKIAKARALELGIKKVVLASTHGYTALKAAEIFAGTGIELISVSITNSFDELGWTMTKEERTRVEAAGVKVLTSLHAFADGIAEGFFGTNTPGAIVANTLYWFSQGTKVAVEISIMAMEAGLISGDSEIIAIAGTDQGCDTALVIKPAFARKVKDLRIREILCKPR